MNMPPVPTPVPSSSSSDGLIERLIEWSARNKFMVFFAVGALFMAGLYCLRRTPLDAIPDLSDVQVIVFTPWEGRSPNLVEDQVTYPIITRLISAPKVRVVRGYSFFGYSFVYVIFEDGTDIYWARSRVLEYMQGLAGQLPPEVTPALGPDATGVGWGFQYALVDRSGKHDLADLRAFQDWHLRYWLQSVNGVAEVASFGGYEKQYQVEVDPDRLLAYNVTLARLVDAIRSANNDVGGREIERNGSTYLVRGHGYISSLEDLRLVVVGADVQGHPILLRDVARNITLGPEMRRGAGDFNGEGEAVGGIVVIRYGQNVLDVIQRLKAKLEAVGPSLPPGVEIVTTYDRSDLIDRSIQTLSRTIIEEAIIVSLVVIIFLLDFGGAARAIVTLPIAVVLAFIPMYFMGLTANIMSLAGIAISIGVLCDEAVVMVENVHKRLEHAPPGLTRAQRDEIIISACKQLGKPLFFALLVITVSFLPVFTLEAQEGRLFKPLAFTKTFTMAWAAVLSVTLGPALIVLMTGARVIPEHRHPISRLLHRLYFPWVSALMRRRFLSIVIALVAVGSAVPVYLRLGSEFMPPLHEGTLLYMPTSLPTMSMTEATRVMQIQDRVLKGFPEVLTVHGKAGRSETATDPAPVEMFETVIQLKPISEWRQVEQRRWYSGWAPSWLAAPLRWIWPERRALSWDELVAEMDAALQLPGVVNAWTMPIKARIDMLNTGVRTPVGIKIFGSDLAEIGRLGEHLEAVLRGVPGTRSVYSERTTGGFYLDIVPRREVIARYGLNVEEVLMIVETAIGGMAIDRTIEGRERFTINVRYSRELRDDFEDLARILVPVGMPAPTPEGASAMNQAAASKAVAQVPLGQLADIRVTTGPPLIKNEDGALTGWVYLDVVGRDIGSYVRDAKVAVRDRIENAGLLPSGYRLDWTGQYEYMLRVRERLVIVLPVTLVLISVLLYLNFKSVTQTLIILLSIPFAMTGSLWMLWAMHYPLSIAVWVGIIALAGLAAQTGTVMIIYLDEAFHAWQRAGRMRTQHDLFEAITYGAVQRVRPKLMTVCMITLGLVPALFAQGAGAEAIQRIAAPMIGGLITSTILTLEIVPAIYSLWRGRQVAWITGPPPPRKSWDELNRQFVEIERTGHASAGEAETAAMQSAETTSTSAVSGAAPASPVSPARRSMTGWKIAWAVVVVLVVIAVLTGLWRLRSASPSAPGQTTVAVEAGDPAAITVTDPVALTSTQLEATRTWVDATSAVAAALAADDLETYNARVTQLAARIEAVDAALSPEHPWKPHIQRVVATEGLKPAASLEEARAAFLPFSVAAVEWMTLARRQHADLATTRIYRCPMAPKPGVWIQSTGPLRNPYYGAEMLDCGVEVP